MVRWLQVAGLSFSLDLPDDFPAAGLLHNYDPFEVALRSGEMAAGSASAPLFKLTITDRKPGEPGEPLLRSKEQTGEPVVGFFRSGEGYQAAFAPTPGARVCGVLEMSGDFRVGQLVRHPSFGRGSVKTMEGDRIRVVFETVGEKLLSLRFAKLQFVC